MATHDLFNEYCAERRAAPIAAHAVEVFAHLTRYVPLEAAGEGLVMFARMEAGDAPRLIREQAEFFRARGQGVEWKVYDRDRPANLRALLEAEGFAAHHDEVFMVRALDDALMGEGLRPGGDVVLRTAVDREGIADVVAVQEAVWNCRLPWLFGQLTEAAARSPADSVIFCAYLGARPVGTGWIDFLPGSRFADLHGGAVLADARGRGIYSLLCERRLDEARTRGCRYLAVDAAPMSRPILEGKGYMRVCNTYPMRSAPHQT